MVKFFGGNGQVYISKKTKRFGSQKHSVRFKMIRKMSLPDNQYELPWLESRYATN